MMNGRPLVGSAITMPDVWCMTDTDNSVYLEKTNYPALKTQLRKEIYKLQMKVRLMRETDSERPARATKIANEAEATLQAI